MNIQLERTCGACPEQYDAIFDGNVVGYLRLRHGYFYASCPGPSGALVYEADTIGDGCFDPSERDMHLSAAKDAIIAWVSARGAEEL